MLTLLLLIASACGSPASGPALTERSFGLIANVSAGAPPFGEDAAAPVLQEVVSGLASPIGITNAGDGSGRLFITLQSGRVLIHDGTRLLPQPFLDIRPFVSCCGERGLLSIAFHPQYRTNGYVFVNYTDIDGNTVVARYSRSAVDSNLADPATAEIILRVQQPFSNHNGGQLQFGPDGYLYIGMGDGGSGGDPGNRAQNLGMLLGKLLRIDVDHGLPYGIPPDNPLVGRPDARGEIWAYGLRNPWRFSFDRQTGDLFIADVGQNRYEEVNFTPAISRGGENYGWRIMEATHCFEPATNCQTLGLTMPVLEYGRGEGCSITGGYRYRGSKIASLRGTYIYGDYCAGTIWAATEGVGGQWSATRLFSTTMRITSFGEDEQGEIYVVDQAGKVMLIRVQPPRSRPASRMSDGAADGELTPS